MEQFTDIAPGLAGLVLKSMPFAVSIIGERGEIVYANDLGQDLLKKLQKQDNKLLAALQINHLLQDKKTVLNHRMVINGIDYAITFTPIPLAPDCWALLALFEEASLYKPLFSQEFDAYQTTIEDLQTIFDNSYDVLYVADGEGRTLRASSACEALWGKQPDELIGRSVYELEQEGVYRPSATRLALERGKKVQIVQQTTTGRRLMVVSTPIKDMHGNIVRVVNASRDITEIHELEQEINQLKSLTEGYRKQLAEVQQAKIHKESQFIYSSHVMTNLIAKLARIASVNSTVLITGESGVGKEVIANYIHQFGPHANQPIIKVNCAAIPDSLLESELFGYEEGAFTGAKKHGKAGLFELANGGTLFLDEVGDMPLGLQAKLLRVLQDGEIRRIGGQKTLEVNVRIIAATNQQMEQRVQNGLFRKDLFYRLNVIAVSIPPLRERREDIVPLLNHFLDRFNKEFGRHVTLSAAAVRILESHPWPGNVRELQNVVERLVVTADGPQVGSEDMPLFMMQSETNQHAFSRSADSSSIHLPESMPLKAATDLVEKHLLQLASQRYRTLNEIAYQLQVNQSTISRKMQKYGIKLRSESASN